MLDTVKENPVPTIIAGLSIGWLVAKGSSDSSSSRSRRDGSDYRRVRTYPRAYEQHPYDPYNEEEYYRQTQRQTQPEHHEASKGASMKKRAGEMGSRARSQATHAGEQAQARARRTAGRAEHVMEENPLAVGAATFALGAMAGLMLPGTQTEDEFMGSTRDRAVEKAQSSARDTMGRAKHVAERTAEEAKETAKEETQKEKEKAKSEKSS